MRPFQRRVTEPGHGRGAAICLRESGRSSSWTCMCGAWHFHYCVSDRVFTETVDGRLQFIGTGSALLHPPEPAAAPEVRARSPGLQRRAADLDAVFANASAASRTAEMGRMGTVGQDPTVRFASQNHEFAPLRLSTKYLNIRRGAQGMRASIQVGVVGDFRQFLVSHCGHHAGQPSLHQQ